MGGFTVKLRKPKLQDPSLAQAPSKVFGGALIMCSHFQVFFFLKNFEKLRYVNQNRSSITEVCQTVN
jgi:hypothetical protein